MNVSYPMLFRIVNPQAQKHTHCGVMEFSAPEGCAYLPLWMMTLLQLNEEDHFFIKSVELKKGELVTFQPHFTKFTELSNPRAVLERALRNFSCLTKGDTIYVTHDEMVFPIDVVKVQPDTSGRAISVVDTDLKVDFEEPKDYAEYMKQKELEKSLNISPRGSPMNFKSKLFDVDDDKLPVESPKMEKPASATSEYFQKLGSGHRLKDKTSPHMYRAQTAPEVEEKKPEQPTIVTEVKGQWKYIYQVDPKTGMKKLQKRVKASSSGFQAFSGTGNALSG